MIDKDTRNFIKGELSEAAKGALNSMIPGRTYYTLGEFPEVIELINAGEIQVSDNPITWAKGPAVTRLK